MTVPQLSTRSAARLLAAAATLSLLALGAVSPANAVPKDPGSADSTSTGQTSTEMTTVTTTTTSTNREKNREKN